MRSLQLKPQSKILNECTIWISQMCFAWCINAIFPRRGESLNLIPRHKHWLIILQFWPVTFTAHRCRHLNIGNGNRWNQSLVGWWNGSLIFIRHLQIVPCTVSPCRGWKFPPFERRRIVRLNITSCNVTRIIILIVLPEFPWIAVEIVIISNVIVIPASVVVVVIVAIAAAVVSIERRPMSIMAGSPLLAIIPCKRHCTCWKIQKKICQKQNNEKLIKK